MVNRRLWLQAAAAMWPFSKVGSAAARKSSPGVYAQLGIRPLINFQGTMTTIGASKMPPEVHEAMAEASRDYVYLEEVKDKVGARIAELCGTEAAMVTSGCAGAIALGTYACLTGEDNVKVRQLPDLTGMKSKVIIQKAHRNGYDHAVRTAGVKVVEVNTKEELANALTSDVAMMYFLGGTSHDWNIEIPIGLEDAIQLTKKAGVPLMVDAANMLPSWPNIPRLAKQGVDLIALSGGKHIRGPQSSGLLAGPKNIIKAAWLNSSPHSDSQGRGMKVNREEMIGFLVALERYVKLDFDALDRESDRQAAFLMDECKKLGLEVEKTPFDKSRRVHRVMVRWDEAKRGMTTKQVEQALKDGEPRIVCLRAPKQGLEFTCFMNDPGDEKLLAKRMKEIFRKA